MTRMHEVRNQIIIDHEKLNSAIGLTVSFQRKIDGRRQKHLNLQAEMSKVDTLFYNYIKRNNNKFTRECYRDYLEYPSIPSKISLNSEELQSQIDYLNDLFPMIHDIDNDVEFQVMTFALSEFKADMYALRLEEKNTTTIAAFTKVISKAVNFNNFEEKVLVRLN